MKIHCMWMIGLAILAVAGCNGTVGTERVAAERHVHSRPDPVLDMLHRGVIDLSVQQDRAGSTVAAFGFLEPAVCNGASQRFAVTLTGTGGKRFRQGPAIWSASGYVEGDTGLQHVQVPATPIVLTR